MDDLKKKNMHSFLYYNKKRQMRVCGEKAKL